MNPLLRLRLRHRLSTRLAVLIAILFFSATAVEVAPKAIDVLQDLGWLAPDAAEAPAEAAALPQPEDTGVRSPATGPVAIVDDAAYGRLVQFAASQPGAFEDLVVSTSAVSTTDETDAAALLEGIVDLDQAPDFAMASLSAYRSSVPGSLGLSAPAFGPLAAMTTTETETSSDLSVLSGALGTDSQLASITSEGTTGGVADKTAGVTNGGTTSSGPTEVPAISSSTVPSEQTSAQLRESSAGYAPASAPPMESGTGFNASLDVSPVAVPEPATLLLLGAGLLGIARYGKRRVAR